MWRIWRFTISPYLHPRRVKELPYWIPYAASYALSILETLALTCNSRIRNGSQEPFAVSVLGTKLYFLTNPADVSESFRNVTTLSWEKYLDVLLVSFGVKKNAMPLLHKDNQSLDRLFSTVTNTNNRARKRKLLDFADLAYRRQLAVDKVDELSSVFFRTLHETASWPQLAYKTTYGSHSRLTVRDLLDRTLARGIAKMFFGEVIFDLEPEMARHTLGFADGLWCLIYRYPRFLAKDFYNSYERILNAIEHFTALDPAETSQASFLIRNMIEAQKLAGLDARSAAALTSVLYEAAFANVHATAFWLLSYILFDNNLRSALCAEILPAFKDGQFDTTYIVQNCPLLESCFREVCRLHIVSYSVRLIEAQTKFGDKVLEPGNMLLVPFGQLHHDENVWGSDHAKFSPTRFLHSKGNSLASNQSYRPFGGGANLCPGKAFANRQVLSFTAYILYSYEVSVPLVDGKAQRMPLIQDNIPTFGTSVPQPGMDPLIDLTPRIIEPIQSIKSWS
ncbi:cytochrome P450 [Mytilinidion resinicola]|uniref:Cytochrome P450 n=1 Tax=Mytilinidion resinicola TaxID=574789 RepID=A0A6A6YFL9_9PEZI|nr:cytochrome P450 [Mytilinidion resinicola]KAF2806677.1 cytochrome P450 [Mytilinidion resinicola]